MRQFSYSSIIGIFTLLAGLLATLCIIVGALSVEYNFDAFSDPLLALQYAAHYKQAYWFAILDMGGYYLFLLPVVFYFYQRYKTLSPWMHLFTFSGAAYIFTGAVGSAMLASIWPRLMQDYLVANEPVKASIALAFKTITLPVTGGLWNCLEVLFAAVWWTGTGALIRKEHPALGWFTMLTGLFAGLDFFGTTVHSHTIGDAGLNAYLLFDIVWSMVIGIHLIRSASTKVTLHPSI